MSGKPIKQALRTPVPVDADALWERIRDRREPRKRWVRALWLLAPAGAALLLWQVLRSPELQRSDAGSLAHVEAGAVPARVALSDGSALELAPGAALQTRALTDQLFETELTRGRVVFDVKPHGPRAWRIHAGATVISVLGTRFSVERERTGDVSVSVQRGQVRVAGPGIANGARILSAGESVRTRTAPAADGVVTATSAPSKPAADGVSDTAQPQADSRSGVPKPAASGVEALLHAADQARAAHQPRRAAQMLARLIAHHRDDPQASLAAFTLGELYLGPLAAPLKAAETFEQARQLGLPAALAEEGAAHLVEAYARAEQHAAALRAAEAYRAQFPEGARRRAVERWVAPQ